MFGKHHHVQTVMFPSRDQDLPGKVSGLPGASRLLLLSLPATDNPAEGAPPQRMRNLLPGLPTALPCSRAAHAGYPRPMHIHWPTGYTPLRASPGNFPLIPMSAMQSQTRSEEPIREPPRFRPIPPLFCAAAFSDAADRARQSCSREEARRSLRTLP